MVVRLGRQAAAPKPKPKPAPKPVYVPPPAARLAGAPQPGGGETAAQVAQAVAAINAASTPAAAPAPAAPAPAAPSGASQADVDALRKEVKGIEKEIGTASVASASDFQQEVDVLRGQVGTLNIVGPWVSKDPPKVAGIWGQLLQGIEAGVSLRDSFANLNHAAAATRDNAAKVRALVADHRTPVFTKEKG